MTRTESRSLRWRAATLAAAVTTLTALAAVPAATTDSPTAASPLLGYQ